jgi:hypothetical protein
MIFVSSHACDLGAVFLGLGKQYEKGDWLVRFDTLQPALQAGLAPTGTCDFSLRFQGEPC